MHRSSMPSAQSPSSSSSRPSTRPGDVKRQHFDHLVTDVLGAGGPASPSSAGNVTAGAEAVPQNEFGGVLVTSEQIHAAFQFLDIEKKQRITPENLRARLSIFYDQLGMRDIKLLFNDQHELTEEYLHALLLTNEVHNFDPMAEAFKAYDPEETGFISRDMLRYVFERLGYGALTEEDVDILIACADHDGDGRISLADFRLLLQE
ncbi:hypothetical protein Poli38472_012529 [Pythium oligandrum]|uniref:EF-hand domain-containing protein n=1 Tax=Pythium oligandrum TaxID=41045 RepID=A0A8K1CE48_PYTOL|nr:hypothetical protein Poli38472_012529 [Pythium oligandrum]|eukprot:TMW61338.1 hypothetical protein Poli38472_012529 [Pythium oligandrum]